MSWESGKRNGGEKSIEGISKMIIRVKINLHYVVSDLLTKLHAVNNWWILYFLIYKNFNY